MKHRSGSLAAQRDRRIEYTKRSGPVSNPGDERMRSAERRKNLRAGERERLRRLAEAQS